MPRILQGELQLHSIFSATENKETKRFASNPAHQTHLFAPSPRQKSLLCHLISIHHASYSGRRPFGFLAILRHHVTSQDGSFKTVLAEELPTSFHTSSPSTVEISIFPKSSIYI